MRSLIYYSISQNYFNYFDLLELGLASGQNNKKLGITGFLSYFNNCFYQYLEGDDHIDLLMRKIEQDNRHQVKKIFHFNKINNRIFPNWNLKLYDDKNISLNEYLLIRNLFSFLENDTTTNQSSFVQNQLNNISMEADRFCFS